MGIYCIDSTCQKHEKLISYEKRFIGNEWKYVALRGGLQMAYNSTNNLPGMSYDEYKRAMDRKRAKEGKRNDDLPEAFLKLFEKNNVQVPSSVKRPVYPEKAEIEEVYEEEEILAEEEVQEPEGEEIVPASGMSRRERRLAREEQALEIEGEEANGDEELSEN